MCIRDRISSLNIYWRTAFVWRHRKCFVYSANNKALRKTNSNQANITYRYNRKMSRDSKHFFLFYLTECHCQCCVLFNQTQPNKLQLISPTWKLVSFSLFFLCFLCTYFFFVIQINNPPNIPKLKFFPFLVFVTFHINFNLIFKGTNVCCFIHAISWRISFLALELRKVYCAER